MSPETLHETKICRRKQWKTLSIARQRRHVNINQIHRTARPICMGAGDKSRPRMTDAHFSRNDSHVSVLLSGHRSLAHKKRLHNVHTFGQHIGNRKYAGAALAASLTDQFEKERSGKGITVLRTPVCEGGATTRIIY